jgi:uncharacterized membrane protein YdbT with pleckstrin-like domain
VSYPERLLSPGEKVVKAFRSHWWVLAPPIVFGVVLIVAIIVGAFFLEGTALWALIGGGVVVWLALSVKPFLDWITTQYVITDERLIYRAGILSRRGKEIPLEVINDVAFTQRFVERLLRSGDLLIDSAGDMGPTRFSNIPDPEGLKSLIYQVRESRAIALRSNNRSLASELETLARLRDQGVLTDEEFESQKRKIIEQG